VTKDSQRIRKPKPLSSVRAPKGPLGGLEIPTRIREYKPRDFASVRRLWRAAGLRLGPSDTRLELERARHRDPDLFLVCAVGAHLIGVVLGRFDGRRGWINHLAVDPRFQGRGVGALLVGELEKRLRIKGCPKVNLHVLADNRYVAGFYRRIGYAPQNLLYMSKWLRK
jgi:ribosomal protein S18 acetylase RimI-like enzyme